MLTSRSGTPTLVKRGDFQAVRVIEHLRTLPDLLLRVEAVDAVSLEDMSALVQSLQRPLGGCMHLPMIVSDRSFASQTLENFEIPFPSKVDAFQVIEKVIDIDRLDFMITFSSSSGMFGNAGQTNYAAYVRCHLSACFL